MTTAPIQVLIVEDEPAHAEAVRRVLTGAETPMEVRIAGSLGQFREAVAACPPHLVLLDLLLPDGRADTALVSPPEFGPFPMVVMTSHGDEQVAVSAIRQGALDYVVKSPQAFADMPRTVERTLREWRTLQESRQAQESLRENERVLRMALEVGRIGAYEIELATGHATWSSTAEEMWGLPAGFAGDIQEYCRRHIHPDDVEQAGEFFARFLEQNQEQENEFRVIRPDGTLRWLRWRGRVLRNEYGSAARIVGVSQDITERKLAAESLAMREEIFTNIASQAEDAISLFDGATGRFVEFNAAAHEGLGYTREEFSQLGIADFQAEHSAAVIQHNMEVIRRQGGLTFETRHRHRDGSLRDVRVRIRSLRIRDRDYMASVWTDITARKLAEARAEREVLRTQFLLELHQRAPHLTDRELFDHVLERAVQLTGSCFGFLHHIAEDQRCVVLSTWNQPAPAGGMTSSDAPYPLEEAGDWADCVRHQRPVVYNDLAASPAQRGFPAGPLPVCRFMGIPVIQGGKVRIVFGVANKATAYNDSDLEQLQVVANELYKITAQRAAQNQLRRSEERFRQLVEALSDWIWEVDATGRYTYASPKVRDLLGYTPEEVVGRTLFDFMPPAEAQRADSVFQALAGECKPFFSQENTYLHRDGHPILVETSGTPVFGDHGELVGYRGIDHDVSERRRLETQLWQAQKLEAIGQLAGGVAHDFNNILSSTMMLLGILKRRPGLDEDVRQILKDLETESQRAAALTRQLLMFSRRSVMEAKPLDLNEVVQNLLKMLGRLIGEQTRLVFDAQPAYLPSVNADAGMLEQVVMNLVVNARDAMPKGGRVTITTSVHMLDAEAAARNPSRQAGRFVCLAVADTGVGMSAEVLGRIFEPFFTTKGAGQGTGLGLATVHGIVAQHKGWVEVASEVGEGTTFRVFLPAIAETAAPAAESAASDALPTGRETILLVEDEAVVRQAVCLTLRALGYRVYDAENWHQAMLLWQDRGLEIDLLFTDMVLPDGLTGLELAELLRTLKPTLKTIISSGYSNEIVRSGGVTQAGIRYLPKPYPARILAETVRSCLDATD